MKGVGYVRTERENRIKKATPLRWKGLANRARWRGREVALFNLRKIREFNARRIKTACKNDGGGKMKERELKDGDLYEARFGYRERRSNAVFFSILAVLFIALLSFRVWWTSNFGGVIVDGESMCNTLYDGEKLLMRYATEKYQPKRGDVIVISVQAYPECDGVKGAFLIKRLIAIEGDKVRCTDGQIQICYAGQEVWTDLDEPYANYGESYKTQYDFKEYEIGEGEMFFLGDNRSREGSSVDSRYQEGLSHLDKLYKIEDVYGVVPAWAIEYNQILEKIFF